MQFTDYTASYTVLVIVITKKNCILISTGSILRTVPSKLLMSFYSHDSTLKGSFAVLLIVHLVLSINSVKYY